ncbi:MAG: hypothetical protein LBU57_04550 [Dysgonamonadaceae bacterium]|jgi:hypothetical protein|nr:hypothetical protein [Dysgonamonadaceae bacterium]
MKKILLAILFIGVAFSCEDEVYSNIPWAPVDLKLHLNGEDNSLNGSLSYKIFIPNKDERTATDKLGYGGILVINGFGNDILNLKAYDLSCPVHAERDVRIKPDKDGLNATCPKCGATYNIASSGAPISGSKYPLKQYNVISSAGISGTYIVTN